MPAKLSVSIALKNIIKAWYELPHQVKAPDSSSLSLKNALAQSSTSSSQVKSVYDNRVNWKAAVSATRNSIKKPMEVIDMTGDDTPTVSSSSSSTTATTSSGLDKTIRTTSKNLKHVMTTKYPYSKTDEPLISFATSSLFPLTRGN